MVDVWKYFRCGHETRSFSGAAGFTNPSQSAISACSLVFTPWEAASTRVITVFAPDLLKLYEVDV